MLINFLYEIVLFLIALIALPKIFYQWIFQKKYQKSLKQKFGADFPVIEKGEGPLIWIHAVSVGETLAIAALAKKIKGELPNSILVVSTTSETGQAEARRSIPFADHYVYLPVDFKWVIDPIISKIKPDLLVLCESDFWFNFMKAAKKQGAILALVNGKLSAKSTHRFKWVPFFAQRLFGLIDHLYIQNKDYDDHFAEIGVLAEKRTVTGNMKFDASHPKLTQEENQIWLQKLGVQEGDQVIVVGSCHDPEEQLILDALKPLWTEFEQLKVIFVPRHPERFTTVAQILQKQPLPTGRFSEGSVMPQTRLILIDTMGLLRKCYQIADLAIVAGSFTPKVGGHNITEPCWYGVPSVYGPHMHTQKELVTLMKSYNAGLQVSPSELTATLQSLLRNPSERAAIGANGLKLISEAHGATEKTWQGIKSLLLQKKSQKVLN